MQCFLSFEFGRWESKSKKKKLKKTIDWAEGWSPDLNLFKN